MTKAIAAEFADVFFFAGPNPQRAKKSGTFSFPRETKREEVRLEANVSVMERGRGGVVVKKFEARTLYGSYEVVGGGVGAVYGR